VTDVATDSCNRFCTRRSAGYVMFMDGYYDTHAAPGSGACREARDGACVMYKEEVRAEAREPRTGCQAQDTGGPETCHTCGAVIGGVSYCSQCNDSGADAAPTDGVCSVDNNECSAKADGRCTTCTGSSFMFKGGCYRTGQAPGQSMCKTAQDGVCTVVADGSKYFLPPTGEADNLHQSVIPCGDDSVVTVKDDKKYKGVANCLTCTAPVSGTANTPMAATCDKCADGYFGDTCTACHQSCRTCSAADENSCTACAEGTHFLGAASGKGKCVSCGDASGSTWKGVANCVKCNKPVNENTPAVCTECADNYYLKTDGATSCVAAGQCNNGFFSTTDSSNKKVCVKCSDKTSGGIDGCAKCSLTTSPAGAGATVTCTECTSNKLSPLGDVCLVACPASTYDSSNVCTPCHTSCSSCFDAASTSCIACYPGSVLNRTTDSSTAGTCIPECTGRYAENCEKDMCTAVLGGSRYCSKCKSGFVPVDGLCVSATTRALTGCISKGDGTCSACTDKYFLESGGCYQAAAYPGSTLCSQAASGKCTNCANGQTADQQTGSCPVCPAGCSKCSGSSGSETCSECLVGYYKSGTSCVKCSENSNGITGIPNCVSCAAPTGSGPITCYVTQTPTVDPTDPSVNKGGLSRGAIAGISVAVIAVVGGLVGFLCWWFVCRGKA
ncbi:Variant-specific surface protein, partial [Giardia duodenalis]